MPDRSIVRVLSMTADRCSVSQGAAKPEIDVAVSDLVAATLPGERIAPVLRPAGAVEHDEAQSDRPRHVAIEGENYHALQALCDLYAHQVDVIYIDPPYNTGSTHWKYLNRYERSEWLNMMRNRLELAKRMLNPAASVLIVAIDENELARLGLLLQQMFPEAARIQQVNVLINAGGIARKQFKRVDEQLLYCFFGDAKACRVASAPDGWMEYGASKPKAQPKKTRARHHGQIQISGLDEPHPPSSPEPALTTPPTVWGRRSHFAGQHGSALLSALLGRRAFDFPKSLYAVRDSLLAVAADNKEALILDFFGGSGTTLHATLLLNEADGGSRRCILVTNNEIGVPAEKEMRSKGFGPSSSEWQSRGVFRTVTRPGIEAAISGRRADGAPLDGEYVFAGGKPMAEGFRAAVDFFKVGYAEPG